MSAPKHRRCVRPWHHKWRLVRITLMGHGILLCDLCGSEAIS